MNESENKNNIPYSKLHYELLKNLIYADFSAAEYKIFLFIYEKTYCYHKKQAEMTNKYISMCLGFS